MFATREKRLRRIKCPANFLQHMVETRIQPINAASFGRVKRLCLGTGCQELIGQSPGVWEGEANASL
jgi:hypothetical protein